MRRPPRCKAGPQEAPLTAAAQLETPPQALLPRGREVQHPSGTTCSSPPCILAKSVPCRPGAELSAEPERKWEAQA